MSLADELRERQIKTGDLKAKFYTCISCEETHESYDLLDKCPACGWEGELSETSSKENAEKLKKQWKVPGYNRTCGNFAKPTEENAALREMEDNLRPYILDPARLMPTVAFPMFLKDNVLCFGLLLPREKDVVAKDGSIIGRVQIQAPVVISSKGEFHQVDAHLNQCKSLSVQFDAIPAELPLRWNPTSLNAFLHAKFEANAPAPVDGNALFKKIKNAYQEYLYFSPASWYDVHALWDMGTYLHQAFYAYPYLELRGIKGSAKTKVMQVSGCMSFNATPVLIAPTAASLFRGTNDKRPTTYLDEAENLFKMMNGKIVHDDRVEIINSGYTREGTVPRMEARGKKFVQMLYHTYSPKMIGSINGLQGATESRSIIHITKRAPDRDLRGEREVDREDSQWEEIRSQLYLFAIQNYELVLTEYRALSNNTLKLKKRDLQLWRPLLAMAKIIGAELYDAVVTFAQQQASLQKLEEINEGSYEWAFLNYMYSSLKGGHNVVLLKELANVAPGEKPPASRTVARILDNFGLRDFKEHTEHGEGYRLTVKQFEETIMPIAPLIFASGTSVSSVKEDIVDDKQIVSILKMPEDTEDNSKPLTEDTEANEDTEAFSDLEALHSREDVVGTVFLELDSARSGLCGYCGNHDAWLRWKNSSGHAICETCKTQEERL